MNIGARIKKLRTEHNLSQEELGSTLGVQRAAVQKWECGAVKNLKRETRRYAKRQITWFKRNEKINWVYPDKMQYSDILDEIFEKISNDLYKKATLMDGSVM